MRKQKKGKVHISGQEKTNELLQKLISMEEERNQKEEEKKSKKTWKERREDAEKEDLIKLEKKIGKTAMAIIARFGVILLIALLIFTSYFTITGKRLVDYFPKHDTAPVQVEQPKDDESDALKETISNQRAIIDSQSELIKQQQTIISQQETIIEGFEKKVEPTSK